MPEPHWIDVPGPGGDLKALTWGPSDGPIALCLHGFPDTAYGWRKMAPRLAESGWRVVAPFMRIGDRPIRWADVQPVLRQHPQKLVVEVVSVSDSCR